MPPTWILSAGSLLLGFAVAAASGHRFLGGIVLIIGGIVCARVWHQRGQRTMWTLVGIYFALFVFSHVLALAITAWPAVFVVAALMGWAAYKLADQRLERVPAGELR